MGDELIGRIIKKRYKLIDVRGNGNFGTVYIARDLNTNYLYAAKVMQLEYVGDSELLERFKREAYILQNLNDPHVVRLVDYGNDGPIYFIVMHHVDGQHLKWFIQNFGPAEPMRALNYITQAAEGLNAAYKKGVVHRDIKPQNILVSNKGVVKIADFGISRGSDTPTITTSGKFMGTVYYAAPEQVESGHTVDVRADLYSLGVVLFELLAGRPPYMGEQAIDIIMKHRSAPIPSIFQFRSDVPAELDAFFQKALAKSPGARYQTPEEFIEALARIQEVIRGPAETEVQARLVIVSTGQTFTLRGQSMIIGRQDPKREIHPDIQIDDSTMTIGRKHARLVCQQGTWMLEDQNSRNKTRVNGVVLVPYDLHPLNNGDLLRFGRVEARFEVH